MRDRNIGNTDKTRTVSQITKRYLLSRTSGGDYSTAWLKFHHYWFIR